MSSKPGLAITAALTAAFAAYTIYVICAGLGFDPLGMSWDFAVSAQLGDSFGPLNSLLALAAAISATAAFLDQKSALNEARTNAKVDAELSYKRDVERTFFNLLQLFKETLGDISTVDANDWRKSLNGRPAVRAILDTDIRKSTGDADADASRFRAAAFKHRDSLSHYFRLFYHILRFINVRDLKIDDKLLYTRLLRAALSDAEITIIALNCIHGSGKPKLKRLLEEYGILHNISERSGIDFNIFDNFDKGAFGDRTAHSKSGKVN
ncbi:hypothetical protein M2341_000935 [Sphingobium sp. B7D2B]|uniref:putative phage abortive infection protein n=1 Tax=Sphingobium sp. B7D2B TaxID=2940583 RepID=UPI002224BEBE|nr:putative phage abortive infection protein [Sphingobium sp. B7D2B]MCW2365488.1 hypothetical protein [Sphingobium sp. B7D2B]